MMTASTDGHGDPRYWLPQSPIVNDFRAAQGDLNCSRNIKGEVTHAETKKNTILHSLIERGFLEYFHTGYGDTLLELHHGFSSRLRHKVNAVFIDQIMGMVSHGEASDMYDEIVRELTFSRVRIIVHACNDAEDIDAACHVMAGINVYRDCFDRLVRALDDARARRKAAKEKELADDPLFR